VRIFAFALVAIFLLTAASAAQPNVQGKWTTLSYTMPINPVHVALLHTGKVLVVSGSGNVAGNTNYRAAIWDPQANTITTQPVAWDMFCNGMAVLPDGRPFIMGGTLQYDPFYGQPKTSIFDPATGTFTDAQNMAHGRWYPTATTLGDGRVMVFSGLNETGGTNTSVEIYTVGTGWSAASTASWTPPLYPRMHLLPNGKVFYSGATTQSRTFDPSTKVWSNVATTNYSGTRTYGSSVLLSLTPANNYDPRVFIMGGGNPSTQSTEVIDLGALTPAWKYGPNMSQPRIEMNAVILPSGQVLALGGSYNDEDTTTASLNADLFDANAASVGSAGANAYARLYHSVALLLPDATVWLAGGNPQRGTYEQHMEIYQPPYLFTTDLNGNPVLATRPSISSAPASISYGNAFTVQTTDAANISSVVLVRNGAVTHAFNTDQRVVGLVFTPGAGTLTVTGPPNGNIAPPGYYMLFLLNNAGVPSVASFVEVAQAPDFSLSANPASQTVAQGNGTTYTINVAALGGFSGTVGLTVSGLPTGATGTFNPTSIAGSGSSTLTINTLSSTTAGSYKLTITGTDGASLTHTASVTLVVNAPSDFTISATPTSQTVTRGSSTSYAVNIGAVGPFSGTVSFSISGLPRRTSASFSPSSVTGSGSSTLTVTANRKAPVGTYTLTITASSGGLSHSTTVGLTIQ
jgi:galactose oxidase-like protein/glyoxal oxidase-like protein